LYFLPVPSPTGGSEHRRLPLETSRVDPPSALDLFFFQALVVFTNGVVSEDDDPVSFMISKHIEDNQSLVHILLSHSGENSKLILTHSLAAWLYQEFNKCLAPVLTITEETQITEWLFGRSELIFTLAEFVAEGDQQSTETTTLILRERQDTSQIVAFGRVFLLREVADEMASGFVTSTHAVEHEGVNVVVEGFVVEEEFAKKTEVATPGALPATVDLEERNVVVAIDLVTGRVDESTLGAMTLESTLIVEVAETELVNVD